MMAISHYAGNSYAFLSSRTDTRDGRLGVGLRLEDGMGIKGIGPPDVGGVSAFYLILCNP
jgi:hypothetical protein